MPRNYTTRRESSRACNREFLRELHRRVLKGIRPADPILETFRGTPEQASALMVRDEMYSSYPKGIYTRRFV
jgi:hypothetical protein